MSENYIVRLRREAAESAAREQFVSDQLTALLATLESPKFRCGDELDGYVSTADIAARVTAIRSLLCA